MRFSPVGSALRDARLRRGLTQKEAGALLGYSASAISRIECGGSVDVATLIQLATEYGVTLAQLGIGSVGSVLDAADRRHDVHRRQFLTLATLSVPLWALTALDDSLAILPEPTTNPSATPVAARLRVCRAWYDSDHNTQLVAGLPELLAVAHRSAEDCDRPEAWANLAACYELATHTLSKLGRHQSSRLTADRAITFARRSQSPVAVGLASRALSIVLRHQDRADLAQRVNLDVLAEVEKTGLTTPEQRTVFVQLLCSAAYAAARGGDTGRAVELTAEADRALCLLPARPTHDATPTNATALSPAQVQLYKVSMYCALGDSGAALEAARGLRPAQFPTPERRGRLFTDITQAWWLHGRPDLAGQALLAAHRHAPAEIVDRRSVRTVADALLENYPHLTEARLLRAALTSAAPR